MRPAGLPAEPFRRADGDVEQEGQIKLRGRMGQRPDRDEVNPGLGHLAHVGEVHPARGFEFGAGPARFTQVHRPLQLLRIHVVEQHPVGTSVNRLGHLIQGLCLDFDQKAG